MRKSFLCLLLFIFSQAARADLYFGGQYGYGLGKTEDLSKNNVYPKGATYSGFIGAYSRFIGIEGIFSKLTLKSDIEHDSNDYALKDEVSVLGGALRFSFKHVYLRGGLASYKVSTTTDATGQDENEINQIYNLRDDETKSGVIFGGGLHWRMTKNSRIYLDYTQYQISGVGNYFTTSLGFAFVIPVEFLTLPDKDF